MGTAAPLFRGLLTQASINRGPCLLWPNGFIDRMPLGMKVDLGPGDIVLDGGPAPPRKGEQQPSLFGPFLLWPNGWMYQDTTRYRDMPRPRRHCVRSPSPALHGKEHSSPHFSAHFALARSLSCSEYFPSSLSIHARTEGVVVFAS